jgi:hypothetical protein
MATKNENGTYSANQADSPDGFFLSGNLPVTENQGVHSVSLLSPSPALEPKRGEVEEKSLDFVLSSN